jgi:cobalt/nickel transport system permease protein
MSKLFSDIFACRENSLSRIDPRVKLVAAFSLILAVILSTGPLLPLIVLTTCVGAMFAVRIPPALVVLRLVAPTGIVLVIVVLKTFLTKGTPLYVVSILDYRLVASGEGLLLGIQIGSRVLGAVSVVLLLSSVTPAHKVFDALRWLRVPATWVEMALLIYRYTFVFLDQAAEVAVAQRVRLGYCGLKRSLISMGTLSGSVIARSVEQSLRTHEAMTLRGYQGQYRFAPLPEIKWADRLALVATPLTIFFIYGLAEWWTK